MKKNAIYKKRSWENGLGLALNSGMGLLGGLTPGLSQTRVLATNQRSRFVRPADLDAFLQGHFNS